MWYNDMHTFCQLPGQINLITSVSIHTQTPVPSSVEVKSALSHCDGNTDLRIKSRLMAEILQCRALFNPS